MTDRNTEIAILHQACIVLARQAGGQLADEAGLNTIQKHCVMTSISELATNILNHAGRGSITVGIVNRSDGTEGIRVVARDHGPGIADTILAMQDGYSTAGSLGAGLPGVNRLMSEMEIFSSPDLGTIVRALKWLDDTTTNRHHPSPSLRERPTVDPSLLNDQSPTNRRRYERFDVAWRSQCESSQALVVGSVENVSEKGAFFRPNTAEASTKRVHSGGAAPVFNEGSNWVLRFQAARGSGPVVVEARVRWVGYNDELACDGVGFEFDARLPDIQRLVPKQSRGSSFLTGTHLLVVLGVLIAGWSWHT